MGCGILSFLVPRCGNGGTNGCGNARMAAAPPFPPEVAAPPAPWGAGLAADAAFTPAAGEASGLGLPGEVAPRPVTMAAFEPAGGAAPAAQAAAPAFQAAAPGGGWLDGLLRGVRGIWDRAVGFVRGLLGDVDRLVQGLR